MNDDDLINELQRLPREQEPPAHVRDTVAAEVTARSKRRRDRLLWRGGVAAAVVIAAFLAGRLSAPSGTTLPTRQFALLLYGGGPATSDRVTEYGVWGREISRQGRAVDGERLSDESWVIGDSSASPRLRGFFIVEARDAEDAQALARSHPHTKYGGTIVVQQVVTRSSR